MLTVVVGVCVDGCNVHGERAAECPPWAPRRPLQPRTHQLRQIPGEPVVSVSALL